MVIFQFNLWQKNSHTKHVYFVNVIVQFKNILLQLKSIEIDKTCYVGLVMVKWFFFSINNSNNGSLYCHMNIRIHIFFFLLNFKDERKRNDISIIYNYYLYTYMVEQMVSYVTAKYVKINIWFDCRFNNYSFAHINQALKIWKIWLLKKIRSITSE